MAAEPGDLDPGRDGRLRRPGLLPGPARAGPSPRRPAETCWSSYLPALSPGHLLGTDPNGNDILSRLLYGGRASLFIATAVNLLGLVVGGTLGALSGYVGGVLDTVIMRVLDVLIAFPSLVLTLAVAQALGPSITNTILALAFFSIPAFARVSRSAVLRLREHALHGGGQDLRHVDLADAVPAPGAQHRAPADHLRDARHGHRDHHRGCAELPRPGRPAPAPSWGNMVATGQLSLSATPMLVVWPSLALLITVLSFNLLGENLRARWSGR